MKTLTLYIFILLTCPLFAASHVVNNVLDDGVGSLRYFIKISQPNDIIEFNPNLFQQGNMILELNSPIEIKHTLTINGLINNEEPLVISGNHKKRIFLLNKNPHVKFNNLVLKDGYTKDNGGAILITEKATLELNNCTISHCIAENGGAIATTLKDYSSNKIPQLIINNTYLHNNIANKYGGGIYTHTYKSFSSVNETVEYFTKSVVRINNSTLAHNKAGDNGGGIYISANAGADITGYDHHLGVNTYTNCIINTSTFYNNYAPEGSSICVVSSSGAVVHLKKAQGSLSGLLYLDIINSTIKGIDSTQNSEIYTYTNIYTSNNSTYSKDTIRVYNSIITSPSSPSMVIYQKDGSHIQTTTKASGHNIFSDQIQLGSVSTDYLNAKQSDINFDHFTNHGGLTPTLSFKLPSVAHNNGNSEDLNDAQNQEIYNTRDIGAFETCNTYHSEEVTAFNSYTWIDGKHYSSSDSNIIYIIDNENDCKNINHLNLKIIPGDQIGIYPSPIFKGSTLHITYKSHKEKSHPIRILNLSGQVIQIYENTSKIGINKTQVSIDKNLPTGMYFVEIPDLNIQGKIMIQNQ